MKQQEAGTRQIIGGRFYNTNYYVTAIVASITTGIDWAAYIGGAPHDASYEQAYQFVADRGCKLDEGLARFIFPDIELPYRR